MVSAKLKTRPKELLTAPELHTHSNSEERDASICESLTPLGLSIPHLINDWNSVLKAQQFLLLKPVNLKHDFIHSEHYTTGYM